MRARTEREIARMRRRARHHRPAARWVCRAKIRASCTGPAPDARRYVEPGRSSRLRRSTSLRARLHCSRRRHAAAATTPPARRGRRPSLRKSAKPRGVEVARKKEKEANVIDIQRGRDRSPRSRARRAASRCRASARSSSTLRPRSAQPPEPGLRIRNKTVKAPKPAQRNQVHPRRQSPPPGAAGGSGSAVSSSRWPSLPSSRSPARCWRSARDGAHAPPSGRKAPLDRRDIARTPLRPASARQNSPRLHLRCALAAGPARFFQHHGFRLACEVAPPRAPGRARRHSPLAAASDDHHLIARSLVSSAGPLVLRCARGLEGLTTLSVDGGACSPAASSETSTPTSSKLGDGMYGIEAASLGHFK